jgi:hypothetical protein
MAASASGLCRDHRPRPAHSHPEPLLICVQGARWSKADLGIQWPHCPHLAPVSDPGLPDIIPLTSSGTYLFTISSNTTAEDIVGQFKLTLRIN